MQSQRSGSESVQTSSNLEKKGERKAKRRSVSLFALRTLFVKKVGDSAESKNRKLIESVCLLLGR